MPCYRPLTAYRGPGGAIVFDAVKSLSRIAFPLPCGRCIGCKMEHARRWGVRCMHEKRCWSSSVYVTLTYNDESMPPGGSLSLRDVQLFMKRLRKNHGGIDEYRDPRSGAVTRPIRFFLGGEYGELNRRPHYHALLFNCDFPDKLLFGRNKRGEPLYTSRTLSDLWSIEGNTLGHCTIGEVTIDSAIYCAKYSLKKYNLRENSTPEERRRYESLYQVYDADGVLIDRRPEFAVMSRRPGIGALYYEKYGDEIRAWDNVIIDGKPQPPPAYYDDQTEKFVGAAHDESAVLCKCLLCVTKRGRKSRAVGNRADNTPERLAVKEKIATIAAEKKERKL